MLSLALDPDHRAHAQVAAGTPAEVIVTAPRGSTSGGMAPLLSLSPEELDSYGADTLNDLVDSLRPLTRSSRSDQTPVVLINGHLAGQVEFDNLPREAVERVDILPESVALQYGFSENQRVLNFILRPHYRATPERLSDSGATDGGAQIVATDVSHVQLEDEARVTVLGSYKNTAWLRESDRGIDLPDSAARTLQPAKTDAKVAATVSRSILDVSASFEASLGLTTTRALQGLGSGSDDAADLLRQASRETTTRLATQLTGQIDRFVWGTTLSYVHIRTRSSSDTAVDATGDTPIDQANSGFEGGTLQVSVSGRAFTAPAGPVIANAKFSMQYQDFDTSDALPGAALSAAHLVRSVRSVRSGNLNASVPLASRERGVAPWLGTLAGTLNVSADAVSDFGTLWSSSWGIDWLPRPKVHLDAILTDHATAPTVQQLRTPLIDTPNFELFDFVTGATAYVTSIGGGDPTLRASDARTASAGVALGPFLGKTTFVAHYEASRTRDAVGALPPLNADVELAFPERFTRDAAGNLLQIDNRWVNLARTRSDDVKWGFNIWVPLGAAASGATPERFEASLFDTWYLHDTLLARGGVPGLDLLNGAPSDVTGGQPRHKIEFHTLVYRQGLGVLLAAAWHPATFVATGNSSSGDAIHFSALGTVDLRVFADLQRMPLTRGFGWATGARMSLSATNLFNRRQAVYDATGATPVGFSPGYLDPAGRVLALTLRKVF